MTRRNISEKPADTDAPSGSSFWREWLKDPRKVGAIASSSPGLARAITADLSASDGPVIELGPGTGVFTAALLARGIPAKDIVAIEASSGFATRLAEIYPEVAVVCGDAARVRHISPFGAKAGVVVCGLPLVSIPPGKVFRIVAGCFAALRPGGSFRLFTYGPRCPVPAVMLDRLDLVAKHVAFVPINIPPASVYVLRRKTAQE